jgi:hypothetical protein
MAKNDEARVAYLTPELVEGLRAQLPRLETLQRQIGAVVPFLFPVLSPRLASRTKCEAGIAMSSFRSRRRR